MELITAVMFIVGIAAGGGGVFFFTKKGNTVDKTELSGPVISGESNSLEIEKLKEIISETDKRFALERADLESEFSHLKQTEIILKEKILSLSANNQNEQNINHDHELANLHSIIEVRNNQINQLEFQINNSETQLKKMHLELNDLIVKYNESHSYINQAENLLAKSKQDLEIEIAKNKEKDSNPTNFKPIESRRVLVVDDSKVVRNKLSNTLKKAGYQVEFAEDGLDAIAKLKLDNNFDLIVTDLEMPNLDGYGLIKSISEDINLKLIPVIAITGHEEITLNISQSEVLVGVQKKPWKDEELLKRLLGLTNLKQD